MSPLRVASVPAAHPYVEHLGPLGATDAPAVVRLEDPRPAGAPAGRWWPPVMLTPAWIHEHAAEFDLLHLHFGAESSTPDELAAALDALEAEGHALVYTAHDLSHPQLEAQDLHLAQLRLLLDRAAEVLTLTDGAAAEIERRWGRTARVVPHPHLAALDGELPAGSAGGPLALGLHLRDLRPGIDGVGATATLLAAAEALREDGHAVVVRVDLRDRVRDEAARDTIRARCADAPGTTLTETPRVPDAELEGALADLDVSVLPYRHGTHSGWLELCWDLGVGVAAPAIGHLADQHPGDPSVRSFAPGSVASLTAALRALVDPRAGSAPAAPRPGSPARRALQHQRRARRERERGTIAAAHEAAYRRALLCDPDTPVRRGAPPGTQT